MNTFTIYCKSIFRDGDHKLEILSVMHIMFTAFACMVVVLFYRHLH